MKRRAIILIFVIALTYGLGRAYFALTGGFTIGNISSDFNPDPRWETHALTVEERQKIDEILDQPFYYLGKGCQSYVFYSKDGQYVLKFLKYQRFRNKPWLEFFKFIPPVGEIREKSLAKKQKKLDDLFGSWRIAFDYLGDQTGLVYVHLNKSNNWNKEIVIFDKIGMKHVLQADQMEFLVQKRAQMLSTTLDQLDEAEAKLLLTKLVKMIEQEYLDGFADNDHALMQNTGVYEGLPIHIDVGQFVISERAKNPDFYHQELYNKMYKFRLWLGKKHPNLLVHLDQELITVLGDDFYRLKHIPKVRD